MIEDKGIRIFLPYKGQWLEGRQGDYLSFFSLTPEVTGFESKGLKYEPPGGRYESSFPLGVSNEFTQDTAWVSWDKGLLLCMHIAR